MKTQNYKRQQALWHKRKERRKKKYKFSVHLLHCSKDEQKEKSKKGKIFLATYVFTCE